MHIINLSIFILVNYCKKNCGTSDDVECSNEEDPYVSTNLKCSCKDEDYLFVEKKCIRKFLP